MSEQCLVFFRKDTSRRVGTGSLLYSYPEVIGEIEVTTGGPEKWAPLQGITSSSEEWATPGYGDLEKRWHDCQRALKADAAKQSHMAGWRRERTRAFAIETGQIEGLYTLRRGVTEQLVAEGFAGVLGAHTLEGLEDETVRGLLEDQEAAYDMMFDDVASGRPLSAHVVKSWHQLLTRHQETVAGIDPYGKRVEVEFKTKGQWKLAPNNPRRPDGVIFEYCPPEQVPPEMDRLFNLYADIQARGLPANAEAAWLHHRFARTHPFQDGNGRVSRLLMAWSFIRRGLPPPIITAQEKADYIAALERADTGNLKAFSDRIGVLALGTLTSAVALAEDALAGKLNRPNGNGGRTVGDDYFPPEVRDTGLQGSSGYKKRTRPKLR